uniref:NADH-ubiquinone oxidoreductase chain 3 n=1 Tax=Macrocheles glaber TaxID=99226 RepID=A0A6B9WH89_9ACAR|nr:NADH dehydrogenase subunit 3 [Macrocheles glaber]QHQ98515.1 NADH dehydrogenase subunit 3 [Macrocheles glaber]
MLLYTIFVFTSIYVIIMFSLHAKCDPNTEQMMAFECGFSPIMANRAPFSLRFFKIMIIFLIFDIEIIIMLPTPTKFITNNPQPYKNYNLILILIISGLYFEWYQGVLSWLK